MSLQTISMGSMESPSNANKPSSIKLGNTSLKEKNGPSNLILKESLRLQAPKLYKIPLIPVNCSFDIVTERTTNTIPLKPMTGQERRVVQSDVTVLFAVRRPGCGSCRFHGRQLTELAKQENICLVGAIKETGVDDPSLLEFYQDYFKFPIYKDEKWNIYNAMGGRKLSVRKLLGNANKLRKRFRKNAIKNVPFGGDIWTQGGVLIFDKQGELRYCYYEDFGDELNIEELRAAVQAARLPAL